jgi:hypothetical protein
METTNIVNDHQHHAFLRAKDRVGMKKAGMHFGHHEHAFHKDDVPAKARAAKLDVNMALPLREKTRWHSETQIGTLKYLGLERCTHQIAKHDPTEYKFNFRAEVLPKSRTASKNAFGITTKLLLGKEHFHRTQEQPVHPNLEDGRPEWNHAQQLANTYSDRAKQLTLQTQLFNKASKAEADRLLAEREAEGRGVRPTLIQREDERMETLREHRTLAYESMSASMLKSVRERQLAWTANIRNETLLHESIKPATAPIRPLPKDSQEVEYIELMKKMSEERETILKATRRNTTILSYKHEGVYQEVKDPDGETRFLWSCCGAYSAGEKGCVKIVIDPKRWTYT